MVSCRKFRFCKSSSTLDEVVVLFKVKQEIFISVVYFFIIKLLFNYKGHIAIGQTDIVPQENPTMTFKIKSITVFVAKFQILFCLFCTFIFNNDVLNIETSKIDSLTHNQNLVSISHIRITFAVPKNMWIVGYIKCFNFLIILKIPKYKSILLLTLSDLNTYSINQIAGSYFFNLTLSFGWRNDQ